MSLGPAQQMAHEIKIEAGKGSVAIGGMAASALTLKQWVMIATLSYIVIQGGILLHKHYYFVKDRKKNRE